MCVYSITYYYTQLDQRWKKDSACHQEVHDLLIRLKHRARVAFARWSWESTSDSASRAPPRQERETRRWRSESDSASIPDDNDIDDSDWTSNDDAQHTRCISQFLG